MDKRILILGSIIAVVILIFASFNSVVGFQSKSISSVKASPLFNTRTKRAIQDKNKDISTCDYLGKGKPDSIPLPTLEGRLTLIKHLIDRISKMNYEAFNRFIALAIKRIKHSEKGKYVNIGELLTAFYLFRTNPEELKNYIKKKNDGILVDEFTSGEFCELWTMVNSKLGDIFWFIIFIGG